MAITFTKDIATDKLLYAYLNNIIEFSSNSVLTPSTAHITGFNIDALIYPNPSGKFYFNLKDYIIKEINTKNFVDDLVTDLTPGDISTFLFDVTDGCYLEDTLTIEITFTDESTESITRDIKFIAGVEQLEKWKKNEIAFAGNPLVILSPVDNRTNNTVRMKYFDGYPFELSFALFTPGTVKINNTTNGLDTTIEPAAKVNSLFFCDGDTSISLEDFLPLTVGTNRLTFDLEGAPLDINLLLDKVEATCGVYIKFLNQYGRWNYWLFSDKHFRNRRSKYGVELENDFNNIEDTISPTLQTTKVSDETIKVASERIYREDKILLEGITDSIKILMFTGERFAKANLNDWIEVTLKTSNFLIHDHSKERYNAYFEFDLPTRNPMRL